jgi:hypothetical protein
MAQEFTINSSAIESKINQLLPSQGGFGAGVDFSASTMVIPIVDLTESAEGSGLREDIQRAYSHNNITNYEVNNANTTVINTTGFWQTFGTVCIDSGAAGNETANLKINDGSTTKSIYKTSVDTAGTSLYTINKFDFIFKLEAGDSFEVDSNGTPVTIIGAIRQIADVNGNLINP